MAAEERIFEQLENVMNASNKQVYAIHSLLKKAGKLPQLEEIVEQYTNGRTGLPYEMSNTEAWNLVNDLKNTPVAENVSGNMMSKLFAMAIEIGWCPQENIVHKNGAIETKRNYSRVHSWVEKYGCIKKPLRKVTYEEMPRLVTQFEQYIYNPYIEKLKTKTDSKSPF